MSKIIVSAAGKDQPGIVGGFTQVLFEAGCNIEDTSMTQLEDFFTMLFILSVPSNSSLETLRELLTPVAKKFHLLLDLHTVEVQQESLSETGTPWMISVVGKDQTGIMYHVTQYMGEKQVNIRQLSSKRLTRKDGTTLFLMALEVDVPAELSADQLTSDLKALALKTGLEITPEQLDVYTL